ncbi:formylglycine-generating enzyme family protein [Oceanicoccus sagamiensis]|uniref:Sulfatase-modifying factor enzyme-like domain-containing protein n=1 Tax=Oceanicoccus sagamiensis TaxID=716816 RepID=A0A1X9NB53_9GAMM|nr:formylglycine-generating enzyme family protein [Oceanicoccus sagamiensis]ARN72769.1 hypothetical protein BST96_00750 [Oceanicoccus sagamiensis]
MTLSFSYARFFLSCLLLTLLAGCSSPGKVDQIADEPAIPHTLTAAEQAIIDQLLNDFVDIAPGSFSMGDIRGSGADDELPVHTVAVSAFAISRYEVTFEQYDLFSKMTGNELPKDRWGRGRRPVIDVTWYDAVDFADWLSEITGQTYRLPTEAEWEYAARAGSDNDYSFGNDDKNLCEYANIADQSTTIGWRNKHCNDNFNTTAPVGSFKPNALGLYDMHGNVWEWLDDCWQKNYNRAPAHSRPLGDDSCSKHGQRGGSWFYGSEEARLSYRAYGNELDKSVTLGFRLVRDDDSTKR